MVAGVVVHSGLTVVIGQAFSGGGFQCQDLYVPALVTMPANILTFGVAGVLIGQRQGRDRVDLSQVVAPRPAVAVLAKAICVVCLVVPVALAGGASASLLFDYFLCGSRSVTASAMIPVLTGTALACAAWALLGAFGTIISRSRLVGLGVVIGLPALVEPLMSQLTLTGGQTWGQLAVAVMPAQATLAALRASATGIGKSIFVPGRISGAVAWLVLCLWVLIAGLGAGLASRPSGSRFRLRGQTE
jgi:hypothetical protein